MRNILKFLVLMVLFLNTIKIEIRVSASTELDIGVDREIKIENYGVFMINDVITIKAIDGEQFTFKEFFLGSDYSLNEESMNFTIIKNNSRLDYTISQIEKNENYSGYRLNLNSPILLVDDKSVQIKASYLFIDDIKVEFDGNYSSEIPIYPLLEYNISRLSTMIASPPGSRFLSYQSPIEFSNSSLNGQWILEHEQEDVSSHSQVDVTITYQPASSEPLVNYYKVEWGVDLESSRMQIQNTYKIRNRDLLLQAINLTLSSDARNIKARDSVGPIKVNTNVTGEKIIASVEPRFPLFQNSIWEFTIIYEFSKNDYIENKGNIRLLKYTTPTFPYYVIDSSLHIILPKGSIISSLPSLNHSIFTDYVGTHLIYYNGIATSGEKNEIAFEYKLNPLANFNISYIIVLIALILIGIYITRTRIRKLGKKHIDEGEGESLRFTDIIQQRIKLLKELEKTERDLSERKISRENYDMKRANIDKEKMQIQKNIEESKKTLSKKDSKLVEPIDQVQKYEKRLENLERDIKNLDSRYRSGRISLNSYYNRRKGLVNRLKDIIKKMEELLENLG
jgi:hypothetical protein